MKAAQNERRDQGSETRFGLNTRMHIAFALMWCAITADRFAPHTWRVPMWAGWLFLYLGIAAIIALTIYFFTHVYTWDYTPRRLSKTEATVDGGAMILTIILIAVNTHLRFFNASH